MATDGSDLNAVLGQFERVEANISKLEAVWSELSEASGDVYEDLVRSFEALTQAIPPIDGFLIDAIPMSESDVSLARFDANEVGEPEAWADAENMIAEPGRQITEYRFRFDRARRAVVRDRILDVVASIDDLVVSMSRQAKEGGWPSQAEWDSLSASVAELDRLVGDTVPGTARWSDLRRHLRFAQEVDLHDIVEMDWPSVKSEVERHLYEGREPVPVQVDDLGALVRARPTGPVSTRLGWERLSDVDFEGLLFELVRTTEGYENVNWLMKTNAPDKGRDIQAARVIHDPLSGTRRLRVIIQCKHWRERSVGRNDLVNCMEAVRLWEPPRIDVLIVATSGRFSQDAVALVEKREEDRAVPRVEPWADSHLETLLARRPQLIARFGLR